MSVELNTPHRMARMLLSLGYERADVREVLADRFPHRPDADYESALADAEEQILAAQATVDAQIHAEGEAAVAAEHDIGRTMHRG